MYKKEEIIETSALAQTETGAVEKVTANREYKDTVFRMLFSEKKELLSLYNAVNNTSYDNPDELQITTLKNAIYMTVKNDISCVIDMRLNLYEHQSTVNPNIPLRDLDYVSRTYSAFYRDKDIYSPRMIKLPNPRFVVFYNGADKQPARREMKLSDAYVNKEEHPSLELIVVQININPGYNDELLDACPTLYGYMQFVERIRQNCKEYPLDEAVSHAVDECIEEGILSEFLKKNKSEVVAMSIYEYDEKLHEKTMIDIGREEGRKEGLEIGRCEVLINLISNKLKKGKDIPTIAEEIEETEERVQELIEKHRLA